MFRPVMLSQPVKAAHHVRRARLRKAPIDHAVGVTVVQRLGRLGAGDVGRRDGADVDRADLAVLVRAHPFGSGIKRALLFPKAAAVANYRVATAHAAGDLTVGPLRQFGVHQHHIDLVQQVGAVALGPVACIVPEGVDHRRPCIAFVDVGGIMRQPRRTCSSDTVMAPADACHPVSVFKQVDGSPHKFGQPFVRLHIPGILVDLGDVQHDTGLRGRLDGQLVQGEVHDQPVMLGCEVGYRRQRLYGRGWGAVPLTAAAALRRKVLMLRS